MTTSTSPSHRPGKPHEAHSGKQAARDAALLELARCDEATVLARTDSRAEGLNEGEIAPREISYGPNQIARTKRRSKPRLLLDNVRNPLIILLLVLSVVSYLTGDLRAAVVMLVMVVLGVVLRFVQEMRADNAAEKLQAMVSSTATVVRGGKEAGDPAQAGWCRAISSGWPPAIWSRRMSGCFPPRTCSSTRRRSPAKRCRWRREPAPRRATIRTRWNLPNICFLGSNVESGAATAVVHAHRGRTYFGSLAASIVGQRQLTSFDKGVNGFTWLMIRFIGRHGAGGVPHQRTEQAQLAGGLPVCDGGGGRAHPRDAAHDRDGQPVQGRPGDGAQESDRQAAERDPELRRDGRAVHRQDRHAHPGQDRPRKASGRARRIPARRCCTTAT